MTWREFQLRRNGYLRLQKEKWYHTRFITYHNLVSVGGLKNVSIEKFMPLDDHISKPKASSEAKELLEQQQREYFKNRK